MYASPECFFGKYVVAKHGPSTMVIHGALYFGIRGGEHITSSVGGQFGIGPASASSLEAGSRIRLVEA